MMIKIILIVTITILYITYIVFKRRKKVIFTDKKVLIIGGTSGLGLSLAKTLKSLKAEVTIAARTQRNIPSDINFFALDILDSQTFTRSKTEYDFIFCCAGSSKPGFFKNLDPSDYINQMQLNYIGPINALYHYYKYNKKPFNYVFISSTAALFTFPGYSAYSPSKCALKSFYESAHLELKKENVNLYIYYPTSMETAGFKEENKIKPEFTKSIEGISGLNPDHAAITLLNGMGTSNVIFSDFLTRVFYHDMRLHAIIDVFYMTLALIICPVARFYVKWRFMSVEL